MSPDERNRSPRPAEQLWHAGGPRTLRVFGLVLVVEAMRCVSRTGHRERVRGVACPGRPAEQRVLYGQRPNPRTERKG